MCIRDRSRTVMLLQKPTEGRIFLEGEELTALSASEVRKRRPDFQMVFQDPFKSAFGFGIFLTPYLKC